MAAFILLYGCDAVLLQTRRWVLEKAGFRIGTAANRPDLDRALHAFPIHLVILCHTLSDREREEALSSAHALQPPVKTLLLTENLFDELPAAGSEVLSANEGPAALIAAVRRLAGQDQVESKSAPRYLQPRGTPFIQP